MSYKLDMNPRQRVIREYLHSRFKSAFLHSFSVPVDYLKSLIYSKRRHKIVLNLWHDRKVLWFTWWKSVSSEICRTEALICDSTRSGRMRTTIKFHDSRSWKHHKENRTTGWRETDRFTHTVGYQSITKFVSDKLVLIGYFHKIFRV